MHQYLENGTRYTVKLLLTNNRKFFQLEPRLMTLDDLELLCSNFIGISLDFAYLGGNNG